MISIKIARDIPIHIRASIEKFSIAPRSIIEARNKDGIPEDSNKSRSEVEGRNPTTRPAPADSPRILSRVGCNSAPTSPIPSKNKQP